VICEGDGDVDIAAGNTIKVMAGVRSDRAAEASTSLTGIFAARNVRDDLLDGLHATRSPPLQAPGTGT
jgi:hypothetical protein